MKIPEEFRLFAALVFFIVLCGISAPSRAEEESVDPEIRIFSLKYAQGRAMVDLIANLVDPDTLLRFHADTRTNSVICKGPPPVLEEIEAILLELDRPVGHNDKQKEATPHVQNAAKKKVTKAPASAFQISSPVSGKISRLVKATRVKKGDLLAIVQPQPSSRRKAELAKATAHSKARRAEIEKEMADLELELSLAQKSHEVTARKLEVTKAKTKVEIATLETELANAESEAAALQDLAKIIGQKHATGTASTADALMARMEAETALGAIELIRLKLALLRNHAAPLEAVVAELELLRSEHELQILKRNREDLEKHMQADLAALQSLKKLQDDRAGREPQVQKIVAPTDGDVSYHGKLRDGALVRENQLLFVLVPAKGDPQK